jgi:pSer/pThr/pTyr-binding forkhead associated (FHA) protein
VASLLVAKADGTLLAKADLSHRRVTTIGRSPRCDLVLASPTVSRRHAVLFRHAEGWRLVDVGSRQGLETEAGPARVVEMDMKSWVRIGSALLWLDSRGAAPAVPFLPDPDEQRLLLEPDRCAEPTVTLIDSTDRPQRRLALTDREGLLVGSSPSCDLVIGDPGVAPVHGLIYREMSRWVVLDAGAGEPTLLVDGRRTRRHRLHGGAVLRVGLHRLIISGPLSGGNDRAEDELEASAAPEPADGAAESRPVSAFLPR